jgi:hypothetical protein
MGGGGGSGDDVVERGREGKGEEARWMDDGGIKQESTGLAYAIRGTMRYTALYVQLYGGRSTPG